MHVYLSIKLTRIFAVVGTFAALVVVVVLLFDAVPWLPRHLVLLFEPSSGIGEPRGYLGERHLGDDGQHDFLALGGVGVLFVLVEPRLERARRLPRGVFSPRAVQVHAVSATNRSM